MSEPTITIELTRDQALLIGAVLFHAFVWDEGMEYGEAAMAFIAELVEKHGMEEVLGLGLPAFMLRALSGVPAAPQTVEGGE